MHNCTRYSVLMLHLQIAHCVSVTDSEVDNTCEFRQKPEPRRRLDNGQMPKLHYFDLLWSCGFVVQLVQQIKVMEFALQAYGHNKFFSGSR